MDNEETKKIETQEEEINLKESFQNALYYILVGVLSVILVVVGPLLDGSTGKLEWNFPKNTLGWILYVISKLAGAGINLSLLYLFIQQAKINVKDNKRYIEARDMIQSAKSKNKKYRPMSPKEYDKHVYTKKGTTIFLMSILGLVALSDLVLRYSPSILISYGVTWVMGIIFGILQMKKKENYFLTEYYDYAVMYSQEQNKEEQK